MFCICKTMRTPSLLCVSMYIHPPKRHAIRRHNSIRTPRSSTSVSLSVSLTYTGSSFIPDMLLLGSTTASSSAPALSLALSSSSSLDANCTA